MIKERFYPRDIELWRDKFDFSDAIGTEKPKFLDFDTRQDLIEFLKSNGVRLDDSENPLLFLRHTHHIFGVCSNVHQGGLLGWVVQK